MSELEQKILDTIRSSIGESIQESLTGYNSPLNALVSNVVTKHSESISQIMNDAFSKVISTEEFRVGVMDAFQHKIAKMMVSNLEGSVQKAVDALRSDPTIRAKMIIAIEEIVKQNMPSKK